MIQQPALALPLATCSPVAHFAHSLSRSLSALCSLALCSLPLHTSEASDWTVLPAAPCSRSVTGSRGLALTLSLDLALWLSLLRRWLCFSHAVEKPSCGSPRELFAQCSLMLDEVCQLGRCSGRFSIVEYSEQRPQLIGGCGGLKRHLRHNG